MGGKNVKTKVVALLLALVLASLIVLSACAPGMPEGMPPAPVRSDDLVPPVRGFYKGEVIHFIHAEASDVQVADMLTMMMGPKVLLVPGLARVPEPVLANVYVFTNGIKGDGPFGSQADVFDWAPGDDGYSPLRSVRLTSWKEGSVARELRSVEEINEAASKNELTIQPRGAVVNMPVLTWPGGQR
ncbi:MAG: hypothetical protein HYY80_01865 [Chloroflexi bacterium]|nr:hypothetical protein [Chloroflexota bacterium]